MATDSNYDDNLPADEPINPLANTIKATILAIVLVSLAGAAYIYWGRPPLEASGNVVRVNAAPMPIQKQTDEGTDIAGNPPDQFIAFVDVHIQNLTDKPLAILEIDADLQENGTTVADPKNPDVTTTTIKRSIGVGNRDYKRLFDVFPQFASFNTKPIPDGYTIPPHSGVDGTCIFSFAVDQKEWDLRKGLLLHVNFDNNTSLKIQAP